MSMWLNKYEGLGNDYFVWNPLCCSKVLTPELVCRICDRHYGGGSDGILVGPVFRGTAAYDTLVKGAGLREDTGVFCGVRILNPDGSEAEKSGNGLRIFAQWLYDHGYLSVGQTVGLLTLGGVVSATVLEPVKRIRLEMGTVSFRSTDLPMTGPDRQVLGEKFQVGDRVFDISAASVGNPHCVVLVQETGATLATTYGPLLEKDPAFPERTNVQFMEVLDEHRIKIEIWERGAGYTLASGSSSSAAAAVAVRRGLCASPVTVCMPGGDLELDIGADWRVTLTGPAGPVCDVLWP